MQVAHAGGGLGARHPATRVTLFAWIAIAFVLVIREKRFETTVVAPCAHSPPKVGDFLVKVLPGLTGDTDHPKGLPLGRGLLFQDVKRDLHASNTSEPEGVRRCQKVSEGVRRKLGTKF